MLEANPCLWDIYHTDYSKRDLKEIAYTEIAISLDTNITSIKAKINSLRTQLEREMAKQKNTKSGQSTDELYASKWIYYDKLNFLIPVSGASKSRDTLKRMNLQEDESAEKEVTPSERKTIAKRNLICFQSVQKLLQSMQSQKQMKLQTQKYLPLLFILIRTFLLMILHTKMCCGPFVEPVVNKMNQELDLHAILLLIFLHLLE